MRLMQKYQSPSIVERSFSNKSLFNDFPQTSDCVILLTKLLKCPRTIIENHGTYYQMWESSIFQQFSAFLKIASKASPSLPNAAHKINFFFNLYCSIVAIHYFSANNQSSKFLSKLPLPLLPAV